MAALRNFSEVDLSKSELEHSIIVNVPSVARNI